MTDFLIEHKKCKNEEIFAYNINIEDIVAWAFSINNNIITIVK